MTRDDYCCDDMYHDLEFSCYGHESRYDCPDYFFDKRPDGSIGLIVHDGGPSSVTISYCPFCGKDLRVPSSDPR